MNPSGPGALEEARLRIVVEISEREMGALRASNCEGGDLSEGCFFKEGECCWFVYRVCSIKSGVIL